MVLRAQVLTMAHAKARQVSFIRLSEEFLSPTLSDPYDYDYISSRLPSEGCYYSQFILDSI